MQQKPTLPQAHGMTGEQIEQKRINKLAGVAPVMVRGNKNPDYVFEKTNEHLVHAQIWMPGFDQNTGKKLHEPKTQMYYKDVFRRMEKENGFVGREVTIFHDDTTAGVEIEADDTAKTAKADKAAKADKVKPLDRMNEKELRAEYKRLFNEDALAEATPDEIRAFITESQNGTGTEETK